MGVGVGYLKGAVLNVPITTSLKMGMYTNVVQSGNSSLFETNDWATVGRVNAGGYPPSTKNTLRWLWSRALEPLSI